MFLSRPEVFATGTPSRILWGPLAGPERPAVDEAPPAMRAQQGREGFACRSGDRANLEAVGQFNEAREALMGDGGIGMHEAVVADLHKRGR